MRLIGWYCYNWPGDSVWPIRWLEEQRSNTGRPHSLCTVLTQSRGCTTNAWVARRLISDNLQKHLPRHLKLNHISATYGCLHQWILALTGTDVRTYTCIRTKGWRDHSSCAWHPHASCGMASSMSSKTVQPWAGHCHPVVANVYVHIWRAPSLSV